MKRLLFSLVLLTTTAFAHPPEKFVKSIRFSALTDRFSASIVLNDGTIWRWVPDIYSEYFLHEWQEGDRIVIGVIEHPGFILHNLDKPRFAPIVALSSICRKKLPTVKALHPDMVVLSDDSAWTPSAEDYYQHLREWRVGDPVILSIGIGGDHEIINAALPYNRKGLDLRYLPVWEDWLKPDMIDVGLEENASAFSPLSEE